MKPLDDFYLDQEEPLKSTYLALRDIILRHDADIQTVWKYALPFFTYKGKMFSYFWFHKKYKLPYIGFVEGGRMEEGFLLKENRSRMKIMLIDPEVDLPIENIKKVLDKALSFYKSGLIPTLKGKQV